MCFAFVSDVLVAVHGDQPPSSSEWRRYLAACANASDKVRANVVVTSGGGPNAAQRAELSNLPNLMTFPTAVVSSSIVVRGIVTAISWLGKRIKAFSPADIDSACRYLALTAETKPKVLLAVRAMQTELGHARAAGSG
jgi:hypothetical protein